MSVHPSIKAPFEDVGWAVKGSAEEEDEAAAAAMAKALDRAHKLRASSGRPACCCCSPWLAERAVVSEKAIDFGSAAFRKKKKCGGLYLPKKHIDSTIQL